MSTFRGLFELQTPADLVRKLRHDLKRMETSPFDQYAAFDFFITAEHIVDWLHPMDEPARKALRVNNALLRITSHLANGSKHFQATAKKHRSVTRTEKFRYVEQGYVEPGYFAEPLLVHLSPDEERELGTSSVDALSLARQVLEVWIRYLSAA